MLKSKQGEMGFGGSYAHAWESRHEEAAHGSE